MKKSLTRDEKVKMLKAIQSGTPVGKVLPTREVCLIEVDNGTYTEYDLKENIGKKVPASELDAYIQEVNKANPMHIIQVVIICNEEFEAITTKLEEEV
jgi:hypothetical protein